MVLLLLCLLVFPMLFLIRVSLDLFVFLFVVVWFSLWFLIFSNLYMMHPEGSELDAALSIICVKHVSFLNNTTTVVHCDKLSFR